MPARVLIVDDDEDIRVILKLLFQGTGCDIAAEAADGIEALEKIEECSPDVVVMDVMMPELNGIETTRKIRERFPAVVVLGFTATGAEDAREILRAGATAVFSKDRFAAVVDHVRALPAA